jgi:hypothetical protein
MAEAETQAGSGTTAEAARWLAWGRQVGLVALALAIASGSVSLLLPGDGELAPDLALRFGVTVPLLLVASLIMPIASTRAMAARTLSSSSLCTPAVRPVFATAADHYW